MMTESPSCGDVGSSVALLARPITAARPSTRNSTVAAPKILTAAEWIVSGLASLTVIFLLVIRSMHAGGLWRDECAALQLAQMPTFSDIAHNFQHEAFPLLFPATVRAYVTLFGSSDFAMRGFGMAIGLGLVAALWIAARIIHRGPPLIATTLLGLNATFLVWGTSVRGYGLGCILIVLAFASFVRLLIDPSPLRIGLASLASLAAVQCLLYNLVLIIAIVLTASAIALFQRQPRKIIVYLSILALCMASFVPYVRPYSTGSAWSVIVEFPVTSQLLWRQFNAALGNPHPVAALFWHFAFFVLFGVSVWRLALGRSERFANRELILFGSVTVIVSLFGYYEFLRLLDYLPRTWYYLALTAIIAVTLDSLGGALSSAHWLRIGRLVFSLVALAVLPFNAWEKLGQRQTNVDLLAKKLAESADSSDLIVVAPWQYGISFGRYYHGQTRWVTLPTIADLRIHRYDLFREKMLSPHPIDDVVDKVRQTLTSGNRVWLVGGVSFPLPGRPPRVLPAPPNASVGWDNVAYSESWLEQLSVFIRDHSVRGQAVAVNCSTPVNQFEDVPLVVVEGWQ